MHFSGCLDLFLYYRIKFDNELWESRYASLKTEKLGTNVLLVSIFFVFYSVCKTKEADRCMNAIGVFMIGCC